MKDLILFKATEHKTRMNTKENKKRLLIIDDEKNMRHMLMNLLKKYGYLVDTASDGFEGMRMIERNLYDFILCDLKMPRMNGMEFLKSIRERLSESTVIMMSAYGTIDTAVEAMKLGAYDYISKPFKTDEVHLALKKADERESLRRENLSLKKRINNIEKKYRFGNMVAKSKIMLSVFKLAEKVAQYNTTVLITGESGTGKEMIAKGIHIAGNRSKMPLITVNCGSIPENLLESELFGYKKGAFTGADRDKKGLFEEANGGTIFLDEIGELPLSLQIKLLRVLQENEIRPIGDSKTKKIDARVIAATARNLEDEIKKGYFREDLYYRLYVIPIKLPALRECIEDIPLLSQHFIERFNKIFKKNIKGIDPAAMALLLKQKWPGNVRELENVIERAVVLADKNILLSQNFSFDSSIEPEKCHIYDTLKEYSLKSAQKGLEKKMITQALMATCGNRTQAARLLELSHPSLLSKIKTYNISI